MENKLQELDALLRIPKCISPYYEDWQSGLKGCLFFDGKNLCVLHTPYRRMDTFVISKIHQEELLICLGEKFVYISGNTQLCAVFAYAQDYYLNHGGKALFDNKELENIWDFPHRNTSYILLDEWHLILTKLLPVSKAHNNCFQPALDYTERCLYKYFQSHSRITQVQDIWFRMEACAKIANHKKNVVLQSRPPLIYCKEDEFEVDANNFEVLSMLHNRFYFFPLFSVTNWSIGEHGEIDGDYLLEFMGITACLASKAIRVCELRKDIPFLHSRAYQEMKIPQDDLMSLDYVEFLSDWKRKPYCYSDESAGLSYLWYISFTLNADKNKLYEFYSKLILPLWKYTVKHSPDIPGIFTSSQMVYSFLLVAEQKMLDYSMQSDVWNTLDEPQQKALKGYADGYFIYLRNIYHADERLFYQALDAYGLSFHDVFIGFPTVTDPNSDWTLINLWLIDKTEVPAHYQEDYDNFHSIMNRYLRNKSQLEDVLSYLLRYDGKFLNLPRHSSGKSKGRLDQTAIREGMEAAGFSFKKSSYSKILSGL